MQVATIQSVSGTVSLLADGAVYSAKVGDAVSLNSIVVTSDNSECVLQSAQGSVTVTAQQKLLLDHDVVGLALDADTEAQINATSFQHAVVQIALADPDHVLTQLLTNINHLLNQSMDKSQFIDAALLEDHSLFLEVESEQLQTQDLLAQGLNASRALNNELSLEEALTGEVLTEQVIDSQDETSGFNDNNSEVLLQILESSQNSMEFDDLIGQLVQAMDLSTHFSDGNEHIVAADSVAELGGRFDDDELFIRDTQYDQI